VTISPSIATKHSRAPLVDGAAFDVETDQPQESPHQNGRDPQIDEQPKIVVVPFRDDGRGFESDPLHKVVATRERVRPAVFQL